MKNLILITLFLFSALLAHGQNYLQEANTCFLQGDYQCAIQKYTLYKGIDGTQDVSVQIRNAQECSEDKITADKMYGDKNYDIAKTYYEKILKINSKDPIAKKQYDLCSAQLNISSSQKAQNSIVADSVRNAPIINYVPNVVFFRINSDKIDPNQKISIYNTAEFIKSTGSKIKVTGYIDKDEETNDEKSDLAKRRVQNVVSELTNTYKISPDKIISECKGSDEQPFSNNNWNRVVIMSALNPSK